MQSSESDETGRTPKTPWRQFKTLMTKATGISVPKKGDNIDAESVEQEENFGPARPPVNSAVFGVGGKPAGGLLALAGMENDSSDDEWSDEDVKPKAAVPAKASAAAVPAKSSVKTSISGAPGFSFRDPTLDDDDDFSAPAPAPNPAPISNPFETPVSKPKLSRSAAPSKAATPATSSLTTTGGFSFRDPTLNDFDDDDVAAAPLPARTPIQQPASALKPPAPAPALPSKPSAATKPVSAKVVHAGSRVPTPAPADPYAVMDEEDVALARMLEEQGLLKPGASGRGGVFGVRAPAVTQSSSSHSPEEKANAGAAAGIASLSSVRRISVSALKPSSAVPSSASRQVTHPEQPASVLVPPAPLGIAMGARRSSLRAVPLVEQQSGQVQAATPMPPAPAPVPAPMAGMVYAPVQGPNGAYMLVQVPAQAPVQGPVPAPVGVVLLPSPAQSKPAPTAPAPAVFSALTTAVLASLGGGTQSAAAQLPRAVAGQPQTVFAPWRPQVAIPAVDRPSSTGIGYGSSSLGFGTDLGVSTVALAATTFSPGRSYAGLYHSEMGESGSGRGVGDGLDTTLHSILAAPSASRVDEGLITDPAVSRILARRQSRIAGNPAELTAGVRAGRSAVTGVAASSMLAQSFASSSYMAGASISSASLGYGVAAGKAGHRSSPAPASPGTAPTLGHGTPVGVASSLSSSIITRRLGQEGAGRVGAGASLDTQRAPPLAAVGGASVDLARPARMEAVTAQRSGRFAALQSAREDLARKLLDKQSKGGLPAPPPTPSPLPVGLHSEPSTLSLSLSSQERGALLSLMAKGLGLGLAGSSEAPIGSGVAGMPEQEDMDRGRDRPAIESRVAPEEIRARLSARRVPPTVQPQAHAPLTQPEGEGPLHRGMPLACTEYTAEALFVAMESGRARVLTGLAPPLLLPVLETLQCLPVPTRGGPHPDLALHVRDRSFVSLDRHATTFVRVEKGSAGGGMLLLHSPVYEPSPTAELPLFSLIHITCAAPCSPADLDPSACPSSLLPAYPHAMALRFQVPVPLALLFTPTHSPAAAGVGRGSVFTTLAQLLCTQDPPAPEGATHLLLDICMRLAAPSPRSRETWLAGLPSLASEACHASPQAASVRVPFTPVLLGGASVGGRSPPAPARRGVTVLVEEEEEEGKEATESQAEGEEEGRDEANGAADHAAKPAVEQLALDHVQGEALIARAMDREEESVSHMHGVRVPSFAPPPMLAPRGGRSPDGAGARRMVARGPQNMLPAPARVQQTSAAPLATAPARVHGHGLEQAPELARPTSAPSVGIRVEPTHPVQALGRIGAAMKALELEQAARPRGWAPPSAHPSPQLPLNMDSVKKEEEEEEEVGGAHSLPPIMLPSLGSRSIVRMVMDVSGGTSSSMVGPTPSPAPVRLHSAPQHTPMPVVRLATVPSVTTDSSGAYAASPGGYGSAGVFHSSAGQADLLHLNRALAEAESRVSAIASRVTRIPHSAHGIEGRVGVGPLSLQVGTIGFRQPTSAAPPTPLPPFGRDLATSPLSSARPPNLGGRGQGLGAQWGGGAGFGSPISLQRVSLAGKAR